MERNVVRFKRFPSSTLDVSITGVIMTVTATVERFFPSILPSFLNDLPQVALVFSLVVCGNGFALAECLESLTDYLLILYVFLSFHASVVRNVRPLLF